MIPFLKCKQYARLMRWDKPIGTLLLLWPTLWALWLASDGKPNATVFIVFVLGVFLMRSAGCVINDLADRHLDGHVARTRDRPLATGKVSIMEALVLFTALCLIAFGLVCCLLNRFTAILAIIGAAGVIVYPLMKRFTDLPQVGLGMVFSWGVPMAFAAETNSIPGIAWFLFFTAMWWPVIYDTMYAMTDRADDIKIGIKSTAILFGNADKYVIALLQMVFLFFLVEVGVLFQLDLFYYLSLLIVAIFFGYQQWLIKDREPVRCFSAFLNNHWVGLVIFIGVVGSYLSSGKIS